MDVREDPCLFKIMDDLIANIERFKSSVTISNVKDKLNSPGFVDRISDVFANVHALNHSLGTFDACAVVDDFALTEQERKYRKVYQDLKTLVFATHLLGASATPN